MQLWDDSETEVELQTLLRILLQHRLETVCQSQKGYETQTSWMTLLLPRSLTRCSLYCESQAGQLIPPSRNCSPSLVHSFRVPFILRCWFLLVLEGPGSGLLLSRAAEIEGCSPGSTAPRVRRDPAGWTDPALFWSAPSHEHMMTKLQQTGRKTWHDWKEN